MRIIILFFLSVILGQGCNDETAVSPEHPNVILILADDQGWGDLSIHGNPDLHTPNIDGLAKGGATFDRFYVQPVCSPTRAEILTGRYHVRSGVRSTSAGGERIDLDEQLISEVFNASGYRTACFGKWHSGSQHPYHPNSRGFDEYYGFTSGHWGHYFDPPLDHNGTMIRGQGYLPDDLTNGAIEFISAEDEPFFIFMAYNTPHSPMQVPDKWWNKFEHKIIEAAPKDSSSQNHARAALAMVENLDWNVGRILQYIRENQMEENTIILYMTDNGPNGVRWNGGMKGRKGSTDEGGVRSPLFVRWKDNISPGIKIKEISAAIDLAPTLIDLCHLIVPEKITYDGISLTPLLHQAESNWPDRTLIHHWRGRTSLRNQNYRLDFENQLYNMASDPSQKDDVSMIHPDLMVALQEIKNGWISEVLSELPESDNRPFPIGYSSSYIDHLPARDGTPHGNIMRSNRYPNDSYFFNWKSTKDSISWDVEILEEGVYEVSLYYTCPSDQLGSQIEVSIGDESLKFKITTPYDSELKGARKDRVERIESYVKDFRKQESGQMTLKKGAALLTVKALNIANKYAADINRISLQRVN